VGEHIRKKRIESGQTQKEVATLIGVDEESIFAWEKGTSTPMVHNYPLIIAYLGYYPLDHETESIGGKLQQVRYCLGFSCKKTAVILGVDTATVRRMELGKRALVKKVHNPIQTMWFELPAYAKQQYRSE